MIIKDRFLFYFLIVFNNNCFVFEKTIFENDPLFWTFEKVIFKKIMSDRFFIQMFYL